MKARKLISLLLVLVMILAMTACAQPETSQGAANAPQENAEKVEDKAPAVESEEPVEIVLWTHYFFDDTTPDDSLGGFWRSVGERYVAETGANVVVKVECVPFGEYLTKLTTGFAAGTGPDVFAICSSILKPFTDSNILLPLNDYYTDEMKEDFFMNIVDGYSVDGNIYSFPYDIGMTALFVNMDALKEADQKVPTNWEELKSVAAALTTEDRWGLVTNVDANGNMHMFFDPFVWMQGHYFTEDGGSALTSKAVTDAMQMWRDLITEGSMPPVNPASGYEIATMLNGGAAMMICGMWNVPTVIADESGMDIDIFPIPTPEGGKLASCAGGWGLTVADNGDSAKAQAAAEFARWLTYESESAAFEAATYEGLIPARRSVLERAQQEVFVGEHWDMLFSQGIVESSIPEMSLDMDVAVIIGNLRANCVADTGRTVEEIAAEADEQLKEYLDSK